ncbi:thioesterase-like superfamily-domain-containing protein [Fennellomyces sp. T-0311]|nr:thioesterase-like superfamily-domain-containing protein [Fennellomyces sp. T-0311]
MPEYDFDNATHISHIGKQSEKRIFTCQLHEGWTMDGVVLGGYLGAVMLKSAMNCYPNRNPAALTAFFTTPGLPGPCVVEVEAIKASKRSFSLISATLKQLAGSDKRSVSIPTLANNYVPMDYVTRCYSVITLNGPAGDDEGPTVIHPNAQKPHPTDNMEPIELKFNEGPERLVLRQDLTITDRTESHHIMSFPDNRPIDTYSLPYLADVYYHPLHILKDKQDQLGRENTWKPTLQYEVQFKYPVPPNTEQVLATFVTHHIVNGRFDLDGWIFHPDGTLLATTRHHAVVIPRHSRRGVTSQKPNKL